MRPAHKEMLEKAKAQNLTRSGVHYEVVLDLQHLYSLYRENYVTVRQ